MQTTINHTCGHEATHQIYGTNARGERTNKIKWLSSTVCKKCYPLQKNHEDALKMNEKIDKEILIKKIMLEVREATAIFDDASDEVLKNTMAEGSKVLTVYLSEDVIEDKREDLITLIEILKSHNL